MAIASLRHVTIVGHVADKARVLEALQEMGCLHLLPCRPAASPQQAGPTPEARRALAFLQGAPRQRRQVTEPTAFDAVAVRDEALKVERELFDLLDERDALLQRIDGLSCWGDFALPPLDQLGGQRLWFYAVPHFQMRRVAELNLAWSVVGRDARMAYVVVVAEDEPQGMPVPRTHTGDRSLASLERRLEQVEVAIEDAEAARAGLTRYRVQLRQAIDRLDDLASRVAAGDRTEDNEHLFGLAGFVPRSDLARLRNYAEHEGLLLVARAPTTEDEPPTLLHNGPLARSGEGLVTFYRTPGYFSWDPSAAVLFSFALFFAMILADAGYALVLGAVLAMGWRRWGVGGAANSLRWTATITVVASVAYGVLVGSYFGWAPTPGTLAASLRVLDANDAATLMPLSVALGGLHLLVANLVEAFRLAPSRAALAPLGWGTVLVGGFALAAPFAGVVLAFLPPQVGWPAMGLGLLAVLAFSEPDRTVGGRLAAGAVALTRISALFGDVLSYLRLFALGLASCSLAIAFNALAADVRAALGPPGIVVAAFVWLLGHGLNLLLSVVGGVVHGLRLNAIEFFNWSLREEGRPFVPFRRKERV